MMDEFFLLRALKAALLENAGAETLLKEAIKTTGQQVTPLHNFNMIAAILLEISNESLLVLALEALGNAVALAAQPPTSTDVLNLGLCILAKTENSEIWTQTLRLVSLVVGDLDQDPPPRALIALCTEIVQSEDSPSALLTYAVEVRRHFPADTDIVKALGVKLDVALNNLKTHENSALIVSLMQALDWLDVAIPGDTRNRAMLAVIDAHRELIQLYISLRLENTQNKTSLLKLLPHTLDCPEHRVLGQH